MNPPSLHFDGFIWGLEKCGGQDAEEDGGAGGWDLQPQRYSYIGATWD